MNMASTISMADSGYLSLDDRQRILKQAGMLPQTRYTRARKAQDAESTAEATTMAQKLPETPKPDSVIDLIAASTPSSPFQPATPSPPSYQDPAILFATSFDGSTAVPSQPSKEIPAPHLPLRKSSVNRLKLHKLRAESDTQSYAGDQSPTSSAKSPDSPVVCSPNSVHSTESHKSKPATSSRSPVSRPSGPGAVPGELPPSPPVRSRTRGFTTVMRYPGLPKSPSVRRIKPSTSIPDLYSSRQMAIANYRAERISAGRSGSSPNSREARHSGVISAQSPATTSSPVMGGGSRSSYKSAFTNGSHFTFASTNYMDGSENERSSVLTKASSFSDLFEKNQRSSSFEDEGLSVDDAIEMYLNGFEDDEEEASSKPEAIASAKSSPAKAMAVLEQSLSFSEDEKSEPSLEEGPSDDIVEEEKEEEEQRMLLGLPDSPSLPEVVETPVNRQSRETTWPGPLSPAVPPKDFNFETMFRLPASDPTDRGLNSPLPPLPPQENSEVREFPMESTPRDRYGFKKVTQYIAIEQYDAWNRDYSDYLDRRREKWLKLMKMSNLPTEKPTRFPPKSDKIKRYIRKGIPPEWRGAAWFWYAGGPQHLVESPGLYWSLLERCEQGQLSDSDREHIERDLHRTFPDNVRFKPDVGADDLNANMPGRDVRPGGTASAEMPILRSLRRVLQAFAVHNPSIGYCQSLNFLAGLLLIFLDEDEEKSFVLLNIITNKHLPGTHAKVLEANVDIGVLMTCVQESMPQIWAKIDDKHETGAATAGLTSTRLPTVSLATTAWFMSLFIGSLPIESVLRVWDCLFYEGSKTLFRIALAIFKTGEQEIKAVNDHLEIFQVVQMVPRKLLDVNALMENCYRRKNGFGHLGQEIIDKRREDRRWALKRERAKANGEAVPEESPEHMDKETAVSSSDRTGGLRRAATRARLIRSLSRKRTAPIAQVEMPA